jgi:hypothetical protein
MESIFPEHSVYFTYMPQKAHFCDIIFWGSQYQAFEKFVFHMKVQVVFIANHPQ